MDDPNGAETPHWRARFFGRLTVVIGACLLPGIVLTWLSNSLDAQRKTETGLIQTFYDGSLLDDTPLFRRTTPDIDLEFLDDRPDLPRRFFAVRWEGVWYRAEDEWIDLYAGGDDSVVVEIDDEVVIARDTERGTNTTFARFELGAGFHRIAVRYQQYAGGLGLHVFVARAGDVPSRIDPESLFPVEPTPGQMGANQRLRVLRRTAMAAWFVPALAFLLWTQGPRTVRAARRSLRACLQRHGVNWRRMSINAPASEPRSMDAPRRMSAIGKGLCAIAVAGFLAGILQFYDATTGFTSLIGFGEQFEEGALDIVWDTPHYVYPRSSGYDGQFYAQLALDPLLRNPDLRDAMDSASYRSRRILFSWTAFVLGMGRPVWILQVFAVQNIISWLLLGWLLRRWLPPVNVRNWLAWCGCMFGYGSIISVRYALTEGPSMVLIALGIVAVERRRSGIAAGIVGLSGLGRETNLLAAVAVGRRMMPAMGTIGVWVKIILLAAGPLTLWLAYTSLVYGPGVWSGEDNVTPPLSGLVQNWTITVRQIRMEGLGSAGYRSLMAMLAVIVQVVYLGWRGTGTCHGGGSASCTRV